MGRWYILHVRTGQEEKIKKLIKNRLNQDVEKVKNIIIPTEDVSEISKGEKKIKSRRYWPGYILIEIDENFDNEITWHSIRTTPGVLGFLGADKKPVPLKDEQVGKIKKELEEKKSKPTPKIEFKPGDKVEITDGPFVNFTGVVEEVNLEKERLKVNVSIFGRGTSLELDDWQVEKI